eukprot:8036421-Pyramimonas_sp.AAC.1
MSAHLRDYRHALRDGAPRLLLRAQGCQLGFGHDWETAPPSAPVASGAEAAEADFAEAAAVRITVRLLASWAVRVAGPLW